MAFTPLPTDPAAWKRAAERVVAWRRAHDTKKHGRRVPLSQAALAERAGVSQGCLQAFENSARATQHESVMRIANAIGLSVEQLFAPEGGAPEIKRVQAKLADTLYGSGAEADGPFTVEANAVRQLYSVAFTRLRMTVYVMLVEHIKHRADPAALDAYRSLQLAGLEPLDDEATTTTSAAPPSNLAIMPPNGKTTPPPPAPSTVKPAAHPRRAVR